MFHPFDYSVTVDNCIITYQPANVATNICLHEQSDCAAGIYGVSQPSTPAPVGLRDGDKTEQVTDLSLNSLAAPLEFIRGYRQSKLDDPDFPQEMGLGWTHNHNLYLDTTSTPDTIFAYLSGGGRAQFDEDTATRYVASAGGTSVIEIDTGSSDERYNLKSDDQTLVFDAEGRLRFRRWITGEEWEYAYYESPHFAEGKLKEVDDGHGRKLQFTYIDNSSGFDHFQLWRVGDQDAVDLDNTTPTGRYVEFTYVEEYGDGSPVTPDPRPLLQQVRDVRGQIWSYQYYGYESGEDDADQLNFLTRCQSPQVDTDGDANPDANITLKALQYTFSSGDLTALTQARGIQDSDPALLTTEYAFQPTNDLTTETVAGRTTNHYFFNGVYIGPQDPLGNQRFQFQDETYRPFQQQDAGGSATQLHWSSNGKRLDTVIDALNNASSFTYDAEDRLATSLDAQQRRTLYIYADANSPRQPSHLLVTDEAFSPSNQIVNGDMEATGNWTSVGTPDTNERSDMVVDTGSYARYVVADEDEGIASVAWDLQANVPYVIRARVYIVSGAVRMGVTGTSDFDAFSSATGEWETLLTIYTPTSSASGVQLVFVADGGSAEFYVDSVYALPGTRLLRWETFSYDSLGRTLVEQSIDPTDGVTMLRQTERSYYTSGSGAGLLESLIQVDPQDAGNNQSTSYTYDSAGRVIKTQRSSLFGSCDISFTVYDLAGNVVATICNYDPGMNPDPTDAAEAAALYNPAEPNKNRVTTHRFDEMGRRVATTVNAGADFAQTTLTLYDALDRPWRVISNYVNPLVSEDPDEYTYTAPGTWIWDEANGRWQDGDETPISHGDDRNQNLISDTAYNARGLTRMQRDVLGNVTLYGYDDADRLVKTVRNASDPDYDNDYSIGDPDLSSYVEDTTAADVDIITQQAYDPAGNLIKAVNPLGITDLTAYDTLNRPAQVVSSASNPNYNLLGYGSFSQYVFSDVSDLDLQRTTIYDALGRTLQTGQIIAKTGAAETWVYTRQVYDALGRQRLTVRNYIDQGEDPALWMWDEAEARWEQSDGTPIEHGAHNDQNLISEQVYDEAGRVRFSRDMAGAKTWQVYDGLGRGVKQIAGCTYTGGSPAPENSSYVGAVDDPAADVIHETYFDVDGRVAKTRLLLRYNAGEDELVRVWTLTGYDALGRQVKTVQNASDPDYDLGADPDLSGYTPSSQPDEDIITETAYDAEGRVYKTTDTLSSVTLYGFDRAGRQVKIIQNASDPDYDVAADPDLSSYTPSAEPDEDIISQTAYDVAGRVVKVTDALGHVTLYGYDRAGRQVKVIQNASDPDYDVAVDPDLSGYTGDNPDPDQDRSAETAYDKAGRTIRMTDAQGNVTLTGYDRAGRQVRVIQNASDPDYDVTIDPDLSSYTGDNPDTDQDRITATACDKSGRVISQTDAGGVVTRHVYDNLGRRLRSVGGYLVQGATDPADWLWNSARRRWEDGAGSPLDHGAAFDRNLISDTAYDLAGQVSATRDARGTLTTFSYDRLGRRLMVTEAVDTNLETVSYTCYDKAGRVERFIRNWQDTGVSPDARDENGDWVFNPTRHGSHNDRDLITRFQHDLAGRRTAVTDPAGNTATTSYFRDGQVDAETDPEGTVTTFRYDGLRRRVLVVQGYNANGEDPSEWVWDAGDTRYEESDGTPIGHGADSDQNIIVQVTYDKGGRLTSLRDPRGSLMEYEYDRLGRRTKLTNPLNDDWLTAYEDLVGGGARVTTTYPGLASGGAYSVQRDFDRLGRPVEIDYGDADVTPRVALEYDPAGNRAVMREYDDSQQIRKTSYLYDTARRLVGVGFDTDGDDNTDETVSYEYDLGGGRTKLTLPGDLSISYRYDAKGQLVGLTDWDGQASDFFYDRAGRQVGTQRANGLLSDYRYNPAGHLRRIRHFVGSLSSLRAHFEFQVDGRGNRTQSFERLAEPTTITDTYDKDAAEVDYTAGTWTDDGDFKKSEQFSAKVQITWTGDEGLLTMGTGPDHSIFDVYIGGTLWQSYDGYASTDGERVIHLPADALLEIRNRADRNIRSTGYVIRFKQLDAVAVTYDERIIQYTYDALSRLTEANYNSGTEVYTYGFDLAGNLTNNGVSRTYNAANQLIHDGTNTITYDNNGNMVNDGVNSYVWDHANRLLSMGGISYAYNGDGNRIQQDALNYILDLQPGLVQVIGDSDGNRYIHSPRGIHAVNDGTGWQYPLADALGSVRGYIDAHSNVISNVNYTPIGVPDANIAGPAFTGEWRTAGTGIQYHSARHLSPGLGVWLSLDPFEGVMDHPMSLNGYNWVEGNVPNRTDASGMIIDQDFFALVGNLPISLNYLGCLSFIRYQTTDAQNQACGLDECDIHYLARAAWSEGLPTSNAAASAIVMIELNNLRNGGSFYPYESVAKFLRGITRIEGDEETRPYQNLSQIEAYTTFRSWCSQNIQASRDALQGSARSAFRIATTMKTGYCRSQSNPLYRIEVNPGFYDIDDSEVPKLQAVRDDTRIRHAHSFCTSVRNVLSDWQSDTGRYGYLLPGASAYQIFWNSNLGRTSRSVIVSNNFNPLHVNWQCNQTQGEITWAIVNSNPATLQVIHPDSCKVCQSNFRWWVSDDGGTTYELRDRTGGSRFAYVYSCTGREGTKCGVIG